MNFVSYLDFVPKMRIAPQGVACDLGPVAKAMEALKIEPVEIVKPAPKKPDFKYINELPEGAQEALDTAVETALKYLCTFEDHKFVPAMRKLFKYIGGGFYGSVFDLGYGLILKINREGGEKDGEVMEALQGVPFIPKLYAYSMDGVFIVSQKVEGCTVSSLYGDPKSAPKKWDMQGFREKLIEFAHKSEELGWIPNDCHGENCMVDTEGNFFIVDLGCFLQNTDRRNSYREYTFDEIIEHGETIQSASQRFCQ